MQLTNDLFFSLLFRNFVGCGTIACHKLDPAGGVGATSAMHDALCLANWINVLPSLDERTVENTFQEYYLERYRVALQFYKDSLRLGTANKKVPNQAVKKKSWSAVVKLPPQRPSFLFFSPLLFPVYRTSKGPSFDLFKEEYPAGFIFCI